ncbi:hypothetical protein HK101_011266 [Irineochytrium annulatum]|nr:hypothetical protein HK101_011266 [Irineochytrium annulatum]
MNNGLLIDRATVIKELWGAFPKFIKIRPQQNLQQLLEPLAANGKVEGIKVTTTEFYNKGLHGNFWTITEAHFSRIEDEVKFKGIKTMFGQAAKSPTNITKWNHIHWQLYEPPGTYSGVMKKLR